MTHEEGTEKPLISESVHIMWTLVVSFYSGPEVLQLKHLISQRDSCHCKEVLLCLNSFVPKNDDIKNLVVEEKTENHQQGDIVLMECYILTLT